MINVLHTINEAEDFAAEFTTILSDPKVTMANKQLYFMDNHDYIKDTMASLNSVITYINNNTKGCTIKPSNMSYEELNEMADQLRRGQTVLEKIKKAISDFQDILTIDKDVKEEDIPTVALTSDSLWAVQPKEEPKETSEEAVEKAPEKAPEKTMRQISQPCDVFYTHAFVVNDEIYYIYAKTKEEVDKAMNDITENIIDDGQEIKTVLLYALTPVDMPLKKRVIFEM